VTHKDLARLARAAGLPAARIVRFCSFSEMDYNPESGLWITLKSGKRAMVLRKKADKCLFQTQNNACAVYGARPQTCRTFPYNVYLEDGETEICLNAAVKCNAEKCKKIDLETLISDTRKENREDAAYHRLVKKWNQSPRKGGAGDFLRFLGF
jgi:Fe-S-cluster containining protein